MLHYQLEQYTSSLPGILAAAQHVAMLIAVKGDCAAMSMDPWHSTSVSFKLVMQHKAHLSTYRSGII